MALLRSCSAAFSWLLHRNSDLAGCRKLASHGGIPQERTAQLCIVQRVRLHTDEALSPRERCIRCTAVHMPFLGWQAVCMGVSSTTRKGAQTEDIPANKAALVALTALVPGAPPPPPHGAPAAKSPLISTVAERRSMVVSRKVRRPCVTALLPRPTRFSYPVASPPLAVHTPLTPRAAPCAHLSLICDCVLCTDMTPTS